VINDNNLICPMLITSN